MNHENILYSIKLMEEAKERGTFDMMRWSSLSTVNSIKDMQNCGVGACFAGHIAISEKFRAEGGYQSCRLPVFKGRYGTEAIALWLGIPEELAVCLVFGNTDNKGWSVFYHCHIMDVGPEDVIAQLHIILSGEAE